jgi:hypothetical protein
MARPKKSILEKLNIIIPILKDKSQELLHQNIWHFINFDAEPTKKEISDYNLLDEKITEIMIIAKSLKKRTKRKC